MNSPLVLSLIAVFAVLAVGTIIRLVAVRKAPPEVAQSRISSVRTWWILTILISIAAIGGRPLTSVLILIAAVIGQHEYLKLVGYSRIGRTTAFAVWLLTGVYGILLLLEHDEWLRTTAPIVFLLVIGGLRPLLGRTEDYIRSTSATFWGLMLFVYSLSHCVFLFQLPEASQPVAGPAGWFLFLIILTETNDIMQALVGRRIGRIRITPRVSPNKSLEGLLGGLLCTVMLAIILAPRLTTLTTSRSLVSGISWSVVAGILISITGFLGDISMSAIKRDAGVKDGSRLLPGHGGMIDRIDSLIYTSPVFWYFTLLMNPSR